MNMNRYERLGRAVVNAVCIFLAGYCFMAGIWTTFSILCSGITTKEIAGVSVFVGAVWGLFGGLIVYLKEGE